MCVRGGGGYLPNLVRVCKRNALEATVALFARNNCTMTNPVGTKSQLRCHNSNMPRIGVKYANLAYLCYDTYTQCYTENIMRNYRVLQLCKF